MLRKNLVGLFTLYLYIECTEILVSKMPILECTYRQLLEACARLDGLYICGGLSENFATLCTILPTNLQQLTLKAVDILGGIKETPWESTVNFAALKFLTISSCFGFTSSHLLYLLHPHPCQSLVYLDLSFSESIFDSDIGKTAEQWGRYFPSLKFLGMRGVFRIDDQMNYAAVSLFQSIFDGSPLLEVVDLSANYPLWQPPSEKRELTKVVIHQLFCPTRLPGLVKSKVLLGLLRCPEEWVASLADEASHSLKSPSILTLYVDSGISDTPQRNHIVLRKRSHCNFSFRDLVNLSSRNSQVP
ncbi:unnamed protein product [Calicophoron daubneyi]|uniref:Uncharacterized protein n=1 Tax=Calicophoron daubneyi TaxID=300641 RepID=A0AAV2T0F2_CALDB